MKTKPLILNFLCVVLALGVLAGCESMGVGTQDDDKVTIRSFIVSDEEGTTGGPKSTTTLFDSPRGIVMNKAGYFYVTDWGNHRIYKVSPQGEVSPFVGSEQGFADGIGSAAQFNQPDKITIDTAGNLYVTDYGNHRIRKVTPKGEVSTVAGGDKGFADGQGRAARFDELGSITIDLEGNLYVVDLAFSNSIIHASSRIRKVTPQGEVSTLVGPGFAELAGKLNGIAIDTAGTLYATYYVGYSPRGRSLFYKISQKGEVSSLSDGEGKELSVDGLGDLAIDATGNLYMTDSQNHVVSKITPKGKVSVLAGIKGYKGEIYKGFADGPGNAAQFTSPFGIALDATGNLYVADTGNKSLRKVAPNGMVSTLVSGEKDISDRRGVYSSYPNSIAIDNANNLYVTGAGEGRIQKISPKGDVSIFIDGERDDKLSYDPIGIAADMKGNIYYMKGNSHSYHILKTSSKKKRIRSLAGKGERFHIGYPSGIVVSNTGNIFVTDGSEILKITPQGEISTFVEGGVLHFSSPEGGGMHCYSLCFPDDLTIDAMDNLYVTNEYRILKITPEGEISDFAGANTTVGEFADGIGYKARFDRPHGITIDPAGNLYVADGFNRRIRKVTPEGVVSTLAGSGEEGFIDGKGSAARFGYPYSIAIDSAGNLYVGDTRYRRIRKITPDGEVSTVVK